MAEALFTIVMITHDVDTLFVSVSIGGPVNYMGVNIGSVINLSDGQSTPASPGRHQQAADAEHHGLL